MITPPTPPSPGQPVSASFFSRLVAWVKSGQLIDGVGYRLSRGPNGTSLVIDRPGAEKAAKSEDRGCFRIVEIEKEAGETEGEISATVTLGNPYFMIGGKLYKTDLDEGATTVSVTLTSGGSDDKLVIALVETAAGSEQSAHVTTFASIAELTSKQADKDNYIVPLYLFNESLDLECDFRTANNNMSMGEF